MDNELQQQQKLIDKVDVALYGVKTRTLSFEEQQAVRSMAERRFQLEAAFERRNPKPQRELTRNEQIEKQKIIIRLAQIERELKR